MAGVDEGTIGQQCDRFSDSSHRSMLERWRPSLRTSSTCSQAGGRCDLFSCSCLSFIGSDDRNTGPPALFGFGEGSMILAPQGEGTEPEVRILFRPPIRPVRHNWPYEYPTDSAVLYSYSYE